MDAFREYAAALHGSIVEAFLAVAKYLEQAFVKVSAPAFSRAKSAPSQSIQVRSLTGQAFAYVPINYHLNSCQFGPAWGHRPRDGAGRRLRDRAAIVPRRLHSGAGSPAGLGGEPGVGVHPRSWFDETLRWNALCRGQKMFRTYSTSHGRPGILTWATSLACFKLLGLAAICERHCRSIPVSERES